MKEVRKFQKVSFLDWVINWGRSIKKKPLFIITSFFLVSLIFVADLMDVFTKFNSFFSIILGSWKQIRKLL